MYPKREMVYLTPESWGETTVVFERDAWSVIQSMQNIGPDFIECAMNDLIEGEFAHGVARFAGYEQRRSNLQRHRYWSYYAKDGKFLGIRRMTDSGY